MMGIIEKVRREREDLARVLKKHKGIRRIVEDLYPDTAHFIYELLQNAEDAGAAEATFILSDSAVTFEHDGRPFGDEDVYAITDIGEGTKAGNDDKIGRFGVGFKSVFAYCETPQIWSPTHSFKISDLVLPSPLDQADGLNGRTRFNFAFNSPKKSRDEAYSEVKSGLSQLSPATLLFLSSLQRIHWQVDGRASEVRRVEHAENHIELVKQTREKNDSAHFLLFEQHVRGLEKQRVAVAFRMDYRPKVRQFTSDKPLAEQLRIIPATPGRVAVYFPAEKETSRLRFHLHAPFVPELSRASIKDTSANEPLFQQLADLSANALDHVRDLGLLSAEFLAVLPNPHDQLPERYSCIRDAIFKAMKTRPLTPTHSESHAPAKRLRQAKSSLKNLLSEEDLASLIEGVDNSPQWAITPTQKNSDVDRFLGGLRIKQWDFRDFVDLLEEKLTNSQWSDPDDHFMTWLRGKPAEWHQKFYALLYDELNSDDELTALQVFQIVRLGDGNYSTGTECFFPSNGVKHDERHPRVDPSVFTSGKKKTEQQKARKCLEQLGVREVGEAEEVQAILDERYSEEAEIPDEKTYLKDLKLFIKLVENDPESNDLFEEYWVLESENLWCKAEDIFLDKPLAETGLRIFHESLSEDHEARRWALANHYSKCRIAKSRVVTFAKAIGVQDQLPVERQSTRKHPSKNELRKDYDSGNTQERQDTKVDKDWMIPGLEDALRHPSKPLANLLWRTLCGLDGEKLKARYRPNQSYRCREEPSSLVLVLQKHRWIPQGRNEFVRPADASRKRLPKGFEVDPDWKWVEAIGFGANDAKKVEQRREEKVMAKRLGFKNLDELERAKRFTTFPPELQDRMLADAEHRQEHEPEQSEARAQVGRNKTGSDAKRQHGSAGSETDESDRSTQAPAELKRESRESRPRQFVSYVAAQPDDEGPDPDGLGHQARMDLEEQAIQLIVSREPALHRTPTNNPGFDLFEENGMGEKCRWVEVKAMTGCLRDRPVGMSRTQFDHAREHGEAFWLYIVEYAGNKDAARILCIQDPAGKAKTFTFDHGWLDVANLGQVAD